MGHPNFENLVKIVKKLRDPNGGCPWDLKQTHHSLTHYLIEESFEFIHAVEEENPAEMEEELGDVLLQVLLHCTIGEEKSSFSIESVSKILGEKLVRRHPHVFTEQQQFDGIDDRQVVRNWEEIKKKEKAGKQQPRFSRGDMVFPSLFSANHIGAKTAKIGFDWKDHGEVAEIVQSEWDELKEEMEQKEFDRERIEEELGDHLFSLAQLARHLKIDPEKALRQANKKFIRRFNAMEAIIEESGQSVDSMNQTEMDVYWERVKENEKKL